jgi:hypothetical protein
MGDAPPSRAMQVNPYKVRCGQMGLFNHRAAAGRTTGIVN